MKPILALTLMLALAGCGSQGNGSNKAGKAAETPAADPAGSAPAAYDVFPAEVRASIYQWDLLNQKCSGRFQRREVQACATRDALSKDLLAKGWCFGGSDDPASQHWLLCAEDYPGGEGWVASPKDAETLPPPQ